jgi:hypothetical protein
LNIAQADAEIVREREQVPEQRHRLQLELDVVLNIGFSARLLAGVAVGIQAHRGALAQGVRQLGPSAERAAAKTERGVRRSKAGKSQKRQYRGGDE